MPTVTQTRVWFLVNRDGDAEPLSKPKDLTRAAQLVQEDPERYSLEQRNHVEIKP